MTGSDLTIDSLRHDVAEVIGESPASLGDDDNLLDRGLDSIRLMVLTERWRAAGASVSFLELAQQPTLAAWRAQIDA